LSLFKNLMNMLLLELFIIRGTLTLIVATSLLTRARSGSLIVLFILIITELYPFCTHLIVIIYVEPYRQNIRKILHLTRFIETPTTDNRVRLL
jgi:hypothetical protein